MGSRMDYTLQMLYLTYNNLLGAIVSLKVQKCKYDKKLKE